ncbi:MAG: AAA family ATPase [Candidatus Cloacimonetes bacterium]|nr:AAA family ATPase [Candidatus Cloacimonadota bacterium]
MMKINKIKIEINTKDGLFGSFFEFVSGLNIIRGNNTSGKSSLFQAIIYCLGFEELLGGRNEKTMQSVLKDQIEFPDDSFHTVIQSYVILEIENKNKEIISIRRSVTSSSGRKPQLIDVYFGSILENPDGNFEYKPMYVHDKGGASNNIYGFHLFLEKFLEINLPNVLLNSGDLRKLYLQQVASSYIIEQKTGWSDFFATMPHYKLQNKEARVIEFLLNMDIYENKKNKQKLLIEKRLIENNWRSLYYRLNRFAEKVGGKLINLSEKPEIINNFDNINIFLRKDEKDYKISDFINLLLDDLTELKKKKINNVSENIENDENELIFFSETLNQESFKNP